jgi:hypothetical protein
LSSSVYVFSDKKKLKKKVHDIDAVQITPNNLLRVLVGPITRSIKKKLKYIFNELIQQVIIKHVNPRCEIDNIVWWTSK